MTSPLVLPARHAFIIASTWIAIAAIAGFDAIFMYLDGIGFAVNTLAVVTGITALLVTIALFYRRFRRDDALWLGAHIGAQLIAGSCALATLSYIIAGLGYPLLDDTFLRFDQAMGFDWLTYIGWVNQHPPVAHLFTICYMLTGPEVVVILLTLCLFKSFTHCHRLALAFLLSAFVTVLISGFMPAVQEYLHRSIQPSAYPNLQVAAAGEYAKDFIAAHNRTLRAIPPVLQGIIAFPSFHSAIGVLAVVASLGVPWVSLRLVIVFVNVVMLLSTPVDGGHYLVDTLAGIALALVVCALMPLLIAKERA